MFGRFGGLGRLALATRAAAGLRRAHHASSSRFARATSARDVAERQYQRDKSVQSERERQDQLEQFRKQYAGVRDETEKMKKMKLTMTL